LSSCARQTSAQCIASTVPVLINEVRATDYVNHLVNRRPGGVKVVAVFRRLAANHPPHWRVSASIGGSGVSLNREPNAERRAAQFRVTQGQLRAVAFNDVLDHRQTDALPRVLRV
jgi:hypothetical protein